MAEMNRVDRGLRTAVAVVSTVGLLSRCVPDKQSSTPVIEGGTVTPVTSPRAPGTAILTASGTPRGLEISPTVATLMATPKTLEATATLTATAEMTKSIFTADQAVLLSAGGGNVGTVLRVIPFNEMATVQAAADRSFPGQRVTYFYVGGNTPAGMGSGFIDAKGEGTVSMGPAEIDDNGQKFVFANYMLNGQLVYVNKETEEQRLLAADFKTGLSNVTGVAWTKVGDKGYVVTMMQQVGGVTTIEFGTVYHRPEKPPVPVATPPTIPTASGTNQPPIEGTAVVTSVNAIETGASAELAKRVDQFMKGEGIYSDQNLSKVVWRKYRDPVTGAFEVVFNDSRETGKNKLLDLPGGRLNGPLELYNSTTPDGKIYKSIVMSGVPLAVIRVDNFEKSGTNQDLIVLGFQYSMGGKVERGVFGFLTIRSGLMISYGLVDSEHRNTQGPFANQVHKNYRDIAPFVRKSADMGAAIVVAVGYCKNPPKLSLDRLIFMNAAGQDLVDGLEAAAHGSPGVSEKLKANLQQVYRQINANAFNGRGLVWQLGELDVSKESTIQ